MRKVWYNRGCPCERRLRRAKKQRTRESGMFNFIIFILGAVLMFYMALRSRAQRHKLCTKGRKFPPGCGAGPEPARRGLCAGV